MFGDKPHVSRRLIGKVDIFDVFGVVEDHTSASIMDYVDNYIRECKLKNVLVNMQSVESIKSDKVEGIVNSLKNTKKCAVYFDSPDLMKQFMCFYKDKKKKITWCKNQKDIVNVFGNDLVEKDKIITFTDRRKNARFKTALMAEIAFINGDDNRISSEAVITNMSDDGIFAEYIDLKSSMQLENLDYFKNLIVDIMVKDTEEPVVKKGKLLRMEFTGKQIGVAIQFQST